MTSSTAPLVSIVIPFLNAGRFLEEAVASVVAQHDQRWELLLVDDGSTDCSTAIARRHAADDPVRVRYLDHAQHRNHGKSTSRNLGIRAAHGAYVTFLDADDVFLPEKLAHQSAILDDHPEVGMVYGRTEYWISWDAAAAGRAGAYGRRPRDFMSRLGVQAPAVIAPPALLTLFLRDPGTVPPICSILVRRSVLDEVGGFDETIQHLFEDQVLLAKLFSTVPAVVDDACGERYRQHPDSSCARAIAAGEYHPWRPNPARRAYLEWLAAYVAERGITDRALRAALGRELAIYRRPLWGQVASPVIYAARRLKEFLG
jgi:glycosyltransferase involved in cell wall biosynthesis